MAPLWPSNLTTRRIDHTDRQRGSVAAMSGRNRVYAGVAEIDTPQGSEERSVEVFALNHDPDRVSVICRVGAAAELVTIEGITVEYDGNHRLHITGTSVTDAVLASIGDAVSITAKAQRITHATYGGKRVVSADRSNIVMTAGQVIYHNHGVTLQPTAGNKVEIPGASIKMTDGLVLVVQWSNVGGAQLIVETGKGCGCGR